MPIVRDSDHRARYPHLTIPTSLATHVTLTNLSSSRRGAADEEGCGANLLIALDFGRKVVTL